MKISAINFATPSRKVNFGNQKLNQTPKNATAIPFAGTPPMSMEEFEKQLKAIQTTHINKSLAKHAEVFEGITLLQQDSVVDRNKGNYQKALETIRTIGKEKLTSTAPLKDLDKKHPYPSIWSVTSEFAPMKEGGLGSVPPEIRNNAEKLGVNMPTFIPMYLYSGKSTLVQTGDNFKYIYKEKEMPLKKLATIKMDVYKDGKPQTIPVDYFLHIDQDKDGNNRQLIFIHAGDYFDGSIYEANAKTEEPEKFALMSKAVYELAKVKMDGVKATKDIQIADEFALHMIKAPDAMILNDWQASPTAALLRYKAVMENAHNQLSKEATEKLKNMNVITIGHNVRYQGSTEKNDPATRAAVTGNILNTLFDKYAYDIVSNAETGASELDSKDERAKMFENALLMEKGTEGGNYTNFLNMGIILTDYFCPVSQNYADELMRPELTHLSKKLQWVITQKHKAGKVVGVINGNDFDNISLEANQKTIKDTTGLDFKIYKKDTPIKEIMQNRRHNKQILFQDFVLPFSESSACSKDKIAGVKTITEKKKLEFAQGTQGTNLPNLSAEDLKDTPIFMSGGRLAGQKGIDVLCDAIQLLLENWDKDFPGKKKPIFYIGGSDGEGGKQRGYIEDLKNNRLSKEDNDRILFAHGWAPMAAMMAGADFFLMPSKFEPCGLTQGESFALGTPVIASAVGGIVDTVNRDGRFNGVLTDKNETLSAQGFYEAMKEGLDIYFNDPAKYEQMVADSIGEDFSWAKDEKSPVFKYFDLLGHRK